MSQLTFPIQQNELRLAVMISLNHPTMMALIAAGQPPPVPIWATGILDTGSSISCVATAIIQQLGISTAAQTRTQTARRSVPVQLFEVSLSIAPVGNLPGPMLTRGDLMVMELADPIPDVEVLIGLDILLDCRLLLDGPGQQFTLDF